MRGRAEVNARKIAKGILRNETTPQIDRRAQARVQFATSGSPERKDREELKRYQNFTIYEDNNGTNLYENAPVGSEHRQKVHRVLESNDPQRDKENKLNDSPTQSPTRQYSH